MINRFKVRTILVAIAAAFALIFGAAAATAAQNTFTVTAGSAPDNTVVGFNANSMDDNEPVRPNGEDILFRNETRDIDMTCETSSAMGDVTTGPGQPGAGIGHITQIDWTTCVGLTLDLCPSANGLPGDPWLLNATSETGGVTTGNISNIDATVVDCSSGGDQCSFDVTGSVPAEYDNATQKLRTFAASPDPEADSQLIIDNVTGSLCPLVMSNGDKASYDSTYQVEAKDPAHDPIAITQD